MKLRVSVLSVVLAIVIAATLSPVANKTSLAAAQATAQATAQASAACTDYKEAPLLADQVKAGKLPAVKDRLPEHPVVVTPAEKTGVYGGSMTDLYDGVRLAEFRHFGYENLVRWNVEGTAVIPNIAESWEINSGATEYTFKLRKGLKWSDGQPFTADDILFWWEEVETNKDIRPDGAQGYFYVSGELAKLTKIDDLTVKFSWSKPFGLFLQNLSTSYGVRVTQFAKHYLAQFSNHLNADGVAKLMKDANEASYGKWWNSHVGSYGSPAEYNDPKRPFMQPWVPATSYVGKDQFTLIRNPYYFKVDPSCNQLPYIDQRVYTLVTDPQVRLLKSANGEEMFSQRDISQPPNRPVFVDNMQKGNFHFIKVTNSDFNTMQLHLNFNHSDPVQAQIFGDKNFRIGLSYGMDRKTVIDTVYLGQGIPYQQAPRPESPYYNKQLATQYTEYDVQKANEALDKVMPKKDDQKFRLRSDGKRFSLTVIVNSGFRRDWVDVMQIVQRNWQALGLDIKLDVVTDDVFNSHRGKPDADSYVWAGENGLGQMSLIASDSWIPEFTQGWKTWHAVQIDPKAKTDVAPVVPPEAIQQMYKIVDALPQAATDADQKKMMDQLFTLGADQFYTIGLSLPAGDYRAVSNRLHNVPETVISGWLYPGPSPINFETFYIDPQK